MGVVSIEEEFYLFSFGFGMRSKYKIRIGKGERWRGGEGRRDER